MQSSLPPPGPATWLDGLGTWTRARKWRQWLVLGAVCLVATVVLLAAWIGVAFLRGSTERDAGAVALNLVLTSFVGIVGLVAMHRGMYRWFWQLSRDRTDGRRRPGDPEPVYGSEPAAPPPRIDWPWTQRLLHLGIYVVGIATLLYTFMPYGNQVAIAGFVLRHSAGRASAGSLSMLLFGYVPMVALTLAAALSTQRRLKKRDLGQLDARGRVLLEADINWLFSFAAAFTTAAILCRLAGGMVVAYL